ncbi:MAG: LuxR C-terminal-related transcriptional regulator [Ilumatobacter fluminis]|uniref:LuxR C-terminal-related transcriptional regulator n=1 Tax=Ilumatobacter fluminis TaxID=467091 RepID=UPI0032ED79F2
MADLAHAPADAPLGGPPVLSTKLHAPRPPATFVSRTRLTGRLDRVAPGTMALVCAPAGCGKSVLVSDWCRRQSSAVAWLSLDVDDNDPIRFWRHVAASLDGAAGDTSASLRAAVDQLARRADAATVDDIVTTIVNSAAADDRDIVLVLEDYHLVVDEGVHDGVRLLLERAPAPLRFVVISRADPPLLLARRRARCELIEIRAADLRFGADEATAFLEQATGVRPADSTVATLTDRTEGWAVGLQLAALSLSGRDDVEAFLGTFTGSHRFVLDYLTEEVLDRQPDRVRDFLLSSSILDRLSGPLCDAVTGGDDGQELLERCERANLFLVPLDDERRWWRYHHLFAELLRTWLDRRPDDEVHELHRRAAAWYESNDLVERAIEHATAAGDTAWAMRLIERHADELLLRREGATLRRRLAELPDGVEASRRLLVAHARTAAYAGRPGEAELLLDAAAHARPEPDDAFEPSIDRAASPLSTLDPTTALVHAFIAHLRGRSDDAVSFAHGALADIEDDSSAVALIAQLHLASAQWVRGEVGPAESALGTNVERWRALGEPGRVAFGCHYLARAQRARGDLDLAIATYRAALDVEADASASGSPAAGVSLIGLGQIAYQRDELESARNLVDRGLEASRQLVYTQALSSGLATMAWIRRCDGDTDEARELMDEAVDVGPDDDVIDLVNPVPVQRARLFLAEGDSAPAERWIRHRAVGLDDEPRHPVEAAHLLLARLTIAEGRGREAVPLLDRLLRTATDDGRVASMIEIELLRALASADDHPADAAASLTRAVVLAAPQRYVRAFVDEGTPVATLLGRVVAAPSPELDRTVLGHVATLIAAFERTPGPAAAAASPAQPLVVPLTDRELEVLAELATGKPNRQIADELYVSLNTVKKHITHILDKLGVSNRTAAVDRARSLGLLP